MKKNILLLLALFIVQTMAYAQCTERYKSRYFSSIQVFRDVVYSMDAPALIGATLTTETVIDKDLVMDVFMPPVTDTVTNRPVVILAHGGGFINVAFMGGTVLVGTMDNEDVQALADTLAHWGFVTASIEYRLGFNVASGSSIKRAVWRGTQDMSAAVRFFRKNAAWFGIDPNRVFTGGSSAGAFCAIHQTFVDYTERLPESYELTPLLKVDLGPLHSRSIVEVTSLNPFSGTSVLGNDVDSIPQGIVSYWGAIADLDWMINGNNKAPIIMFHGTEDLVVDNKCAKPFSSIIVVAPESCGTYMMDSVLTAHSMPHEAHYAQGENHEYWGALNGDWTSSGPNAYWPDMIQKTAHFFYDIMQPDPPQIAGPDTVLSSTNYTYSIVNPMSNQTYCWEVTGGVVVSPVSNAPTVDIQFYNTTTQGMVKAFAIDPAEVVSDEGSKLSTVTTNIAVEKIALPSLSMQLQPNPAHQQFAMLINSSKAMAGQLAIYNSLGQQVFTQKMQLQNGENQQTIRVENLPKGIYGVEFSTEQINLVKQIVLY